MSDAIGDDRVPKRYQRDDGRETLDVMVEESAALLAREMAKALAPALGERLACTIITLVGPSPLQRITAAVIGHALKRKYLDRLGKKGPVEEDRAKAEFYGRFRDHNLGVPGVDDPRVYRTTTVGDHPASTVDRGDEPCAVCAGAGYGCAECGCAECGYKGCPHDGGA